MVSEKYVKEIAKAFGKFNNLEDSEKELVLERVKQLAENEESAEQKAKNKKKNEWAFDYLLGDD